MTMKSQTASTLHWEAAPPVNDNLFFSLSLFRSLSLPPSLSFSLSLFLSESYVAASINTGCQDNPKPQLALAHCHFFCLYLWCELLKNINICPTTCPHHLGRGRGRGGSFTGLFLDTLFCPLTTACQNAPWLHQIINSNVLFICLWEDYNHDFPMEMDKAPPR